MTEAHLREVLAPVLVLHGDGDPIFPLRHAEWAAASLPDARLQVMDAMGHALAPAFFNAIVGAVRAFIDDCRSRLHGRVRLGEGGPIETGRRSVDRP